LTLIHFPFDVSRVAVVSPILAFVPGWFDVAVATVVADTFHLVADGGA
jgi:hypothetical protein